MPILFEHAWCVDETGRPVEVTLREGRHNDLRYFGVVLHRLFIEKLLRANRSPPFLDRTSVSTLEALPRDRWRDPLTDLPKTE